MADAGIIVEGIEELAIADLKEENAKLKDENAELKKELKEKEEEDEEQVNEKEQAEQYKEQLLARLKKKLEDTGLPHYVVAQQLGIDNNTLTHWLSGNRPIREKNCKKLAEWLDAEVTGWTTQEKAALIAKLQKTINDKGISQATAAKELEVQKSTLTNWFTGTHGMQYKQCDKIHRWIQDKEKTV